MSEQHKCTLLPAMDVSELISSVKSSLLIIGLHDNEPPPICDRRMIDT